MGFPATAIVEEGLNARTVTRAGDPQIVTRGITGSND